MPKMTWKQLRELIEKDGWFLHHQTGSHRQFHHSMKTGTVTLAYHKIGDMVPQGILASVLRQGGLK